MENCKEVIPHLPSGRGRAGETTIQYLEEREDKTMANLTGKHQDKIPGMGGHVNAGPDLQPKQPTPYLYDAPCDVPHPDKHQSGVGGPSDRNNNGVDDSGE